MSVQRYTGEDGTGTVTLSTVPCCSKVAFKAKSIAGSSSQIAVVRQGVAGMDEGSRRSVGWHGLVDVVVALGWGDA